jgi:hypothetical protein
MEVGLLSTDTTQQKLSKRQGKALVFALQQYGRDSPEYQRQKATIMGRNDQSPIDRSSNPLLQHGVEPIGTESGPKHPPVRPDLFSSVRSSDAAKTGLNEQLFVRAEEGRSAGPQLSQISAAAPTSTPPPLIVFRAVTAVALRHFTDTRVLSDTALIELAATKAIKRFEEEKIPQQTQKIQGRNAGDGANIHQTAIFDTKAHRDLRMYKHDLAKRKNTAYMTSRDVNTYIVKKDTADLTCRYVE